LSLKQKEVRTKKAEDIYNFEADIDKFPSIPSTSILVSNLKMNSNKTLSKQSRLKILDTLFVSNPDLLLLWNQD
jgi:hypothetical protein